MFRPTHWGWIMSHTPGYYLIYTRPQVADDWILQPTLRLQGGDPVVERKAASVTTVQIEQTNVAGTQAVTPTNFAHHWLRISYTPDGGAEVDIFYGHFGDQTIDEKAGVRFWPGLSIEAQLERALCFEALADRPAPADAELIDLPTFNADVERRQGMLTGTAYHCTRDVTFATPEPTGPGGDAWYGFGEDEFSLPWTAWGVIEALVRWHTPPGGYEYCKIGFLPVITDEAINALDEISERWDFFGRSLFDVLNTLCAAAGDLSWTCDWSQEDGTDFGYELVRVYIFSRDHDDRDAARQAEHAMVRTDDDGNRQCLASRISVSVRDAVHGVIAYGEPIRVQFTTQWTGVDLPMYRAGWTSGDETDWANQALAGEAMPTAYRKLILPAGQTHDGVESTWKVFVRPDPAYQIAEPGDAWAVPTPDFEGNGAHYPRAILPRNLTRTGRTYTSQTGSTALSHSDAGVIGYPEFAPILAWLRPDSIGATDRVMRIPGVRPLRTECGVMLPPGWRGGEDARQGCADLSADYGASPACQQIRVTVTIETDMRAQWLTTAYPRLPSPDTLFDEQHRYVSIYVPGAHWWAALDAVVDIAADGTETVANGVLRNDIPRLKAAAEQALARFNSRTAHADINLMAVDPSRKLGDFVTSYTTPTVDVTLNNCIAQLRYHLGGLALGTEVITGLPRR